MYALTILARLRTAACVRPKKVISLDLSSLLSPMPGKKVGENVNSTEFYCF